MDIGPQMASPVMHLVSKLVQENAFLILVYACHVAQDSTLSITANF